MLLALTAAPSLCNALSISHVSHAPVYVDSASGEEVSVRFKLDEHADIRLNIYDDREYLIKQVSLTNVAIGDNEISWDLTDMRGKEVPPEAYHYTLEAKSGNTTVVFDVSDTTGNKPTRVNNVKWDKTKQIVSYYVLEPSRVSIRAGIDDGGPLLATITDWQARNRGPHQDPWGGYDKDKVLNIEKMDNVIIHAGAISLSDNSIIIGPPQTESVYVKKITQPVIRERKDKSAKAAYANLSKSADLRSDYDIDIDILTEGSNEASEPVVLTGTVPIRISMSNVEQGRMQQDRFEPMLFIDGIYVTEVETGFFPVTWKLDTTKYDEGEHFITVNIRGYGGQYGVASRLIRIKHIDSK
jgi:hypothetical protein